MSVNSKKIAVKINDVHKSFHLPVGGGQTLKSSVLNAAKRRKKYIEQQVLRGVSLEIMEGEFFGIAGRNGGGKSTLLKIIAGIYEPSSGSVEVSGNLTPFIELGVGFNAELTGRENVYMNGALLGLSKTEVDKIYDAIVDFAELEQFMDQKLKNYSSGMKVRLAFSVAIQAHSDILLIDEVLAVGDANFQEKCFKTFEVFKKEGRTVVFISHSMSMVTRFCDRAALLDKGMVVALGEPGVIATEYDLLNDVEQKMNKKRLKVKTYREAHIVDKVREDFNTEDRLVEIAAGKGRHSALISSLGLSVQAIDRSDFGSTENKIPVLKSIDDIDEPAKISGLLLLDNLASLDMDYLESVFAELTPGGKLQGVNQVYVHIPFSQYQKHLQDGDKKALTHLGMPLSMASIAQGLEKKEFYAVSSEIYGVDALSEYSDCLFKRFDDAAKQALWEK